MHQYRLDARYEDLVRECEEAEAAQKRPREKITVRLLEIPLQRKRLTKIRLTVYVVLTILLLSLTQEEIWAEIMRAAILLR